ncbi:hypothetical protein F2P56_022004 [Juglans regia]|uniref:Retrovirus-related Pol polyprotein from transposon TNT 1-94-like beta-barrel domain-containing protein n=1 Tax=Juglans regia TaxID=51240 RepID=A0A833UPV7_JUGRE|nr:hypothetical protein F2P56_022004 [Juglans regia]
MFTSQSQAKVFQIRHQLTNLKKGSLSIIDYYRKVRLLSDTMIVAGEPLRDSEVVSYLLNGLNSEFDTFVISVTTRATPISSAELFNLLLTLESRISLTSTQQGLLPTPSVNLTTNTTSRAPRGNQRGGRYGNCSGRTRGGHSFSPFQQPSPQQQSKPTCQVCQKIGHVALQYYHRFDQAYQFDPPCSLSTYTNTQSQTDKQWYPDSTATNHITSDFQNLNILSDAYSGPEKIKVGDGTALPITHFGDSSLSSSHSKFLLRKLLFVSKITKNLVSVNRFCFDNAVFFEFHDSFFYVKDKRTGAI